jgi:hypothetical protein
LSVFNGQTNYYQVTAVNSAESSPSPTLAVVPHAFANDDEFLEYVQQCHFDYFWYGGNPANGMVPDRLPNPAPCSIAAVGFGLTAYPIGVERQYITRAQARDRVLATLRFFVRAPNEHGFFYHFIDMNTGTRVGSSEVSSIDTSILLCGVLACRQYFQEAQIHSLATQIYNRVNWPWMLNGGATFSQGWTPESGFIATRWDTYSELMMLYLLAIGSTTNPVPASSWDAFARPTLTYQGLTYITSPSAPLFIHQYSHAWFDFRNKSDKHGNYFNNSVAATQAHKLFCLSLQSQFSDYQSNLWGITASDSANGYVVWGGPPAMGPIDGSIVPCAAGGSLPFVSSDCLAVLRSIRSQYPQVWQRYGFVDAFNPLHGWYDPDVIGIDVGITMLMAENQRSSFVWNTFMSNPEAQNAFAAVELK